MAFASIGKQLSSEGIDRLFDQVFGEIQKPPIETDRFMDEIRLSQEETEASIRMGARRSRKPRHP